MTEVQFFFQNNWASNIVFIHNLKKKYLTMKFKFEINYANNYFTLQ